MGFSVTYLSFCQFIQIVILKWSRQNDIIVSELQLAAWGQVLVFSIGYLRMRSMQLEKLHAFGRHKTSCLSFSKMYAIEDHSLLKSLFGYTRRNARIFSNLSVTRVTKNGSDSARELLLPHHPLLWVVRICIGQQMNKIYVRKRWAIVNIQLFFLKH